MYTYTCVYMYMFILKPGSEEERLLKPGYIYFAS